jgi:hypothetical protein
MATPISQIRKAHRYTDRSCEICRRQTDGISSLCKRHLERRGRHGSVKVTQQLRHRDYSHLIGLATKYLKANPPPSNITESIQRFLQPPGPLPRGSDGWRKRQLLIAEMARWSDPRYQKKVTDHGGWSRKAEYSARGILAVLIAVKAYVEEREGRGFPHDSEETAMMFALTRLWKRPRAYSQGLKGRVQPVRYSQRASKTVLRGLVRRWREFTAVGVYVLQTARIILAEYRVTEAERIKKLPRVYSQEEMKILHDRQKREAEARVFEQQRAAFLREPPVPDPGPRTFGAWDGSAEMQRQIMAWSEASSRFQEYERRRKKFDVR